jgi:F-type H+-transporting ATPase subunit b
MFSLSSQGLPLGFNIYEVLIHIFNFLLLMVGLRFLLYKPIKKFMAKREAEYKAAEQAAASAAAEAAEKKLEAEQIIVEARQQAVQMAEDAAEAASMQTREIITAAKEQAKDMAEKARLDILHEQSKAKEELLFSVSELAVDMASRILEREVKAEDNDSVINAIIEEWKDEQLKEEELKEDA